MHSLDNRRILLLCVGIQTCVHLSTITAHLQVKLRRERSVFHIADIVLGEVQVGEVSEATERGIMD